MRIVLLATNLARGGAETQVALLARELHQRGHHATIISLLPPSISVDAPRLASLHMRPGRADPRSLWRLALELRKLRPQVLHAHMFHANVMARIVRLIAPAPVVISTIHSTAESGRGSRNAAWRDWVYRITDPLADATVAVSEAVAERHAPLARKLRVIPNGVDASRFFPGAPRARSREFVWLAVGRLMWKKDYPTLLRAFAGLDGAVLRIAGAGPDEAVLRAQAGPSVTFLGEREDTPELLQAADGFVLSSVVEGLPMALLEAAASGLPIVATDVGGVREAAPDASVVKAGDADALRAAMRRVMDLPEQERRRIGQAARARVEARFDLGRIVSRWERLYNELLER